MNAVGSTVPLQIHRHLCPGRKTGDAAKFDPPRPEHHGVHGDSQLDLRCFGRRRIGRRKMRVVESFRAHITNER